MASVKLNQTITKTILLIGVFLFAISLLLPENFRNVPLILFVLSAMLSLFIKFRFRKKLLKFFIINTLLFFVLVFSLSYTQNIVFGLKLVTRLSGLLIIPLSFLIIGVDEQVFNEKRNQVFYKIFFITTILFFIAVFIQNYYRGFLNDLIFLHFSERLNSTYHKYSLHPIYASIYVCISLILSTEILPPIKKTAYKMFYIFGIVFLIMILLMLARKGPVLVMILICVSYFFFKQTKKMFIVYFVIALLVFVVISYLIEPIKVRYLELFNFFFNFKENGLGSTSFRVNTYQCALEAIGDSQIFGYGLGDTKQILIECYKDKNNIYSSQYFNSHNQFLSAWLAAGIFGVLSLILIFYYNFKLAIKRVDFIHFSVLLLFSLVMVVENILERQNGIILFSFFINFFAFKSIKSNS